jgi:hypothetical protein
MTQKFYDIMLGAALTVMILAMLGVLAGGIWAFIYCMGMP